MKFLFYLPLAISFLMSDCSDIEFNDNERLLISSKIVNPSGDGIEGIRVSVFGEGSSFSEQIGYNYSDNNGNIDVIALSPSNENSYDIVINGESNDFTIENQLEKIIYTLDVNEISNLNLKLPDVVLRSHARLFIDFVNVSATTNLIRYQVNYALQITQIEYFTGDLFETGFLSGELNPNEPLEPIIINTLLTSTAILNYQEINEAGEVIQQNSQPILIDDLLSNYEIEY